MNPLVENRLLLTRRHFFGLSRLGLGTAALACLMNDELLASAEGAATSPQGISHGGLSDLPHFPPRAKRVIYLFQSGAPSQMDLFDYKPKLAELRGTELPASVRQGQRLTTMTSGQASFPVTPSLFRFAQHGESDAWASDWKR